MASIPAKRKGQNFLSSWGVNMAIALTALRTNLMRSILTMLGVLIGVFAVTLAVAVGNGAQESVMQSINSFGSNMAIIVPEPDNEGGRRSFDRGRLTSRDLRAIEREVPGVIATAPQLTARERRAASGRRPGRQTAPPPTPPSRPLTI